MGQVKALLPRAEPRAWDVLFSAHKNRRGTTMSSKNSAETSEREGVQIVTLRSGSAVAEIAPALGNNCFSFVTDLPVLEPVAFADFIAKPTSYGIPIMVPFPNRIRDGRFRFGGAEYAVDPPRHGMVRDKTWMLVETGASDGGAWVTARIDAGDFPNEILSQFPFRFVADVTYGLTDRTLDMVTVVTNRGDSAMPLGFGIHPYFRRPERGTVTVPACSRWELEESLPTGAVVEVDEHYDLRGGRTTVGLELDDVYSDLTPDDDGLVRCTIVDLDARSRTIVEFDPSELPYTVVFTPPAPRSAVCVEPQTCPTDAFNLSDRGIHANVITLEPDETRRFTLRIRG